MSMITSAPFHITQLHLWIAFALLIVVAVTMGAIFFFHWRNYGFRSSYTILAESVFIGVTLAILLSSVLGIISFSVF